ncbi:MAG: HAD family phosphatase [Bacteroidota bacterium]
MSSIKNIIFDFGGVVLNIDFQLTIDAFKKLGIKNPEELVTKFKQANTFILLEKNEIGQKEFFNELKLYADKFISDEELLLAWNALLLDIPKYRIFLLKNIKSNYRTFLLSNTNKIHYDKYLLDMQNEHGVKSFDDLFEKAYFSFDHGMVKPDKEFYQKVLSENNLNPSETIYIDDLEKNLLPAQELGMYVYHLKDEDDIVELFDEEFTLLQ